MTSQSESVNLSEIPAEFANGADELSPPQKAQYRMTYWVLGGAVLILAASGAGYIFCDNGISQYSQDIRTLCAKDTATTTEFCKKYLSEQFTSTSTAAKEVFEFCKNFIPPIVTLVLGAHYVTKNMENS
jgi:hypothetical protein